MRIGLFLLALTIPACTIDSKPGPTEGENTSSTTASTGTSMSSAGTASTGTDDDGVGAACKPAAGGTCPMSQTCCSDDPATVGGKKPNYYMDGVNDANYGIPLFSDNNNALSFWGHCIATGGFASPLSNGCPVPCNPTWEPSWIGEICGTAECCSFTALDPDKDCIEDGGKWRAVTGADIAAGLTMWGENHSTNQDPDFASCETFAMGNADALADCKAQLSVADRRGYCYSGGCPCVEDVCDQKNPGWVPRCTGNDPTSTSDGV